MENFKYLMPESKLFACWHLFFPIQKKEISVCFWVLVALWWSNWRRTDSSSELRGARSLALACCAALTLLSGPTLFPIKLAQNRLPLHRGLVGLLRVLSQLLSYKAERDVSSARFTLKHCACKKKKPQKAQRLRCRVTALRAWLCPVLLVCLFIWLIIKRAQF